MLGLVKWYAYTKYAHKDEILVTTHPYRMYESDVIRRLRSAGFALLKIEGHTFRSNLLGHARDSTFLVNEDLTEGERRYSWHAGREKRPQVPSSTLFRPNFNGLSDFFPCCLQ